MTVHHEIPTDEDLQRLEEPASHAITLYVPTSPVPSDRRANQVALKSAFDAAVREVKGNDSTAAEVAGLREQWRQVDEDPELWGELATSLAVFLTPEWNEVYVLPNRLEAESQVSNRFDLGQLLRSVTYPHEAYALTLSANGWTLWQATAEQRIAPVELVGDHPEDLDEVANQDLEGGGQRNLQRIGDYDHSEYLSRYAVKVAGAVAFELDRREVKSDVPFFVFATEPLLGLFADRFRRDVVRVPGAPDALGADHLDAVVRAGLDEVYTGLADAELSRVADVASAGLAETDLSVIARAAIIGAVHTLLFDFSVEHFGRVDANTGEVHWAPEGARSFEDGTPAYNVVSRVAVLVLAQGGRVFAVRDSEVSNPIWNSVAVARLRHAL